MEKEVVLDVAQRLGALIEERLADEVVYTRATIPSFRSKSVPPWPTRSRRTCSSRFTPTQASASATGAETYYLNFTTSKSAMDVAARENASSETEHP